MAMTTKPSDTNESLDLGLGAVKFRKPSVATNLSFLFSGLGQIYCGWIKRGLIQLCATALLLVVAIFVIAVQAAPPLATCIVMLVLYSAVTIYSGIEARFLARQTRPDYRLKDYNSIAVYVALSFLVAAVAAGFALSIREHFLQAFKMTGASMAPTLPDGSRILVRRDSYLDVDPQANDLVAFRNPTNRRQTWVKRVVGLPGDRVSIESGVVYVNGKVFKEAESVDLDESTVEEVLVPDQHCYVLGDNRAESRDSRMLGPVPMIALVGKVIYAR